MEGKSKTIEKISKPETTPVRDVAATRQLQNPVLQDGYGSFDVQRAAGNLAIQRLARRGAGSGAPQPGPATQAALSRSSRGEQLPTSVRTTMADAFHSDLSGVRIHTDTQASNAARELNAQAFTWGQDIYFGAGRYQPNTIEGRTLLAHELTHIIQQGQAQSPATSTVQSSQDVSQPGDPLEREADAVADQVESGQLVSLYNISGAEAGALRRQPLTASPSESSSGNFGGGTFGGAGAGGIWTPAPVPSVTPPSPAVPGTTPPAPVPAPAVSPPTGAPAPAPGTPPPSSTTEIIFPPFTVFQAEEQTVDILYLPLLTYPIWATVIALPPPLFFATVGLYANIDFKLELFLRYGPAMIRDIRLALDRLANRYSGTGQFYMPVEAGPRATLKGSLTASAELLGFLEVLAIEGGLTAVGQAPLILVLSPSVNLIYDSGTFSFNLRPQIEAGFALIFDLNAFAQARVAGDVVWKKIWNLYHWQWGRAVRFGTLMSLDYIHGHLRPIRTQGFGERITIDELLQGMKEPAQEGGIQIIPAGRRPPLQERLRQLLDTGGDPHVILAALAEASDSEKSAILGDGAMMSALQSSVGNELWPTAQRILTNAPSETTPSLDEGTVFIANRHIALGRFQDALQVVISRLQARGIIDATLCNFTYTRETTMGEGMTSTTYTIDPHGMRIPSGPSQVQIYDPAFVNVPWLYSTIMHEYVHVLQHQRNITPTEWADPDKVDRSEVEAYLWEIEHARGSGVIVSPAQMREIGQRLTQHFNALTPPTQAIYRDRYNAARALVDAATSGIAPVNLTYSIADARRMLQESSQRIAELVRSRPRAGTNPAEEARIDGLIASIQRERAEALVEVVLADNPTVQIEDRARGIYRVPVVDGSGRVQWIYGSIIVVWHLRQLSPSVFTIRATIRSQPTAAALPPGTRVVPRLLVGGSAIQSTIQPFPGDIDFAEEFDITAPDVASAGAALAETIVEFVYRNSGNPNLEFMSLRIMPPGKGTTTIWHRDDILDGSKRAELARQLASIAGGRINTSWRALIAGGRYIEITKVLSVNAISSITGETLFSTEPTGAEFQEAYLDEAPPQIEPSSLGWYAQLMHKKAIEEADDGNYLKAAKRAFNYLRAIGNLEGMAAVRPIFATESARINQQVAVLEAITQALDPKFPSRILTVNIARDRLNETATLIELTMPGEAAELRYIAAAIRGVGGGTSDPVAPDLTLSVQLGLTTDSIKANINSALRVQVTDIIDRYVR